MPAKTYPRTMLALLTAINFFNYIDRSVLFAVQPLIQKEFHRSDLNFGLLSTAFFGTYMVAAPFLGALADRYPRKIIITTGILLWSGATLLTAFAFDFNTLLVRHTIVGIGEASYAAAAPSLIADLFHENRRGRMLAVFFMAIPVGTAMGYLIGGVLGERYGWRAPFYVGAVPGFLLAITLVFLREPERGASDRLRETPERGSVLGLVRNGAFVTATLGMAMMTFCLGGLQTWMPTFLTRVRGIGLDHANLMFGASTAITGIFGTLLGGWLGDRLLRRTSGAYYLVSAGTLALGIPAMLGAIYLSGRGMFPAIFVAEFLLLMNTGPLNAAVVNSVGAHIRSTAIAVNLFVIHLLGDAFSPTLIGYISDRSNLQTGFVTTIVAIALSAAILLYGMRFAPRLPANHNAGLGASA
ncbi:MAG TPA: MFS transporter [Terriglobales bacterium]|nr:MFS transporter [Terriglobales bacterium]